MTTKMLIAVPSGTYLVLDTRLAVEVLERAKVVECEEGRYSRDKNSKYKLSNDRLEVEILNDEQLLISGANLS